MGPSSEKEQQCDNHAKLSRQIHVCKERKGMSQRTGRSIRELTPLPDGFSTLRPIMVRRRNHISIDVLSLILCSDRNLI